MADPQDVLISNGSVSVNGKPIAVAATATPGTKLHECDAVSTILHRVVLTASNSDGTNRAEIVVELTNVSDVTASGTSERMFTTLAQKATAVIGEYLVTNGVKVRAYCPTSGSIVNIHVRVYAYIQPT